MRQYGRAGPAPESPKIEQDNFAAVVGQLEALALHVLALDFRRHFADREAPAFEQFGAREFTEGAFPKRMVDVAVGISDSATR